MENTSVFIKTYASNGNIILEQNYNKDGKKRWNF